MTIYSLHPQGENEPEILSEEEVSWQEPRWRKQPPRQPPSRARRALGWISIRLLILMGLAVAVGWMALCMVMIAWRMIRYAINWKRREMKPRIQKAWSFFLMGAMAVVGGCIALWKIQAGVSWIAKRFVGGWAGQGSGFTGSTIFVHPLFYKIFARF